MKQQIILSLILLSFIACEANFLKQDSTSSFSCKNPQVTTCYKAKKSSCYDAMVKADKETKDALRGLPVEPGMDTFLMNGKNFTEKFTWTIDGDDVYISVLEFERLGFLQDIQLAVTTLQLEGAMPSDLQQQYKQAYDKMGIEMVYIFEEVCWANPINKPSLSSQDAQQKIISKVSNDSTFTCKNPQVTTCYKAKKSKCYDAMVKADQETKDALQGLPVEPGMDTFLMNGKNFTEKFTWTLEGDDIYISVLEFERLGFLQDIQLAITTLQLEGAMPSDLQQQYKQAYDKMGIEMVYIFEEVCWANPINKPSLSSLDIQQKVGQKLSNESTFTCKNPQVTTCYKAEKSKCYDAMVKADQESKNALKGLPVEPGMDTFLMNGKNFTEKFTWTLEGDYVYISVLEFERLGFLQDIQLAITTLQLEGAMPGELQQQYKQAYDKMGIEMVYIFEQVCWANPINKPNSGNIQSKKLMIE